MVNELIFTLVAAIAVIGVMVVPVILSRRIKHGEARFESENGKLKDDE